MRNKNFNMGALICAGAVATITLVAVSASCIGQEPTPQPYGYPVSAFAQEHKALPPSAPAPLLVGEKAASVEPHSTPPTEIDFEPPTPNSSTAITTSKETQRGNTTQEPSSAPTPSTQAPVEPKMGDTRISDGQPQVYILGFGWIEDNNEPNIGIAVDGDDDINKMVGSMGSEYVNGCIEKTVGTMG